MLFGPGSNMMKDYDRNRNLNKRDKGNPSTDHVGYQPMKTAEYSMEEMMEIKNRQKMQAKSRKKHNLIALSIILGLSGTIITVLLILFRQWLN